MKTLALTTSTALLLAGAATAQVFGPTYGTDLDRDTFGTGFQSTGYYNAVDINDDTYVDQNEFSTGLYSSYDMDNDLQITEDEFQTGYTNWWGTDGYDTTWYDTYDVDSSGYLDQSEFGQFYGDEYGDYYAELDVNDDDLLTEDEYTTGVYNAADLDRNAVISIEEEGWFEGWFDGDDIEAEIESVGPVYSDT
ncbi:hypothetical protein [Jannaschia formosa]|uniref:hypothetical protein n=1 Tax=Jannaschia formosa TaxID=2259592 RepID=UPI000E1BB384|nr:hypothetical protein [Jannaschia formosa]TFL17065.1 hypothetical protein DR046_16785 [Jannaschia formosa]